MKTVYKYKIEKKNRQTIEMPSRSQILCLQLQGGCPYIWVAVEPIGSSVNKTFDTYVTGEALPDYPGVYIGTYQIDELVYHVFERF
ncbi:DUF7352 domain-containing protein [Chryseobacterium culicis]|uniref:DUF7352 domain-containing protein n=1 Tax=Chryseobacterium culicis TaxID=680127 RepID=UPI00187356F8|nr:hypothetical protein [Chryseobacterium culicis]MBE4949927.1 hypothetical protein [Chryseobacterium culicis]